MTNFISLLNQNGFKISTISQFTTSKIHEKIESLNVLNSKYPEQVNKLVLCMIELDENQFNICMEYNIKNWGFENTMINIIHPFLMKIGFLWQTDAISPAHEHFISNLIRQKIISEINTIEYLPTKESKKYLLYLPEDEYHELGILYCHYMLKIRQNYVLYLGQNLPFVDMKIVHDIVKPDYVFTIMTSSLHNFTTEEYITKLSTEFQKTKILITGFQVVEYELPTFENVTLLYKFEDILKFTN